MKLRCVMKRTDNGYVGVCLELSLAIRGKTPDECKEKLERLINDYIDTTNELYQGGEKVILRPVKYYCFKRIYFDLKMCYFQITNRDISRAGFIQKRVVFVGI